MILNLQKVKNHNCSKWFQNHILNSIFCFSSLCFNDCFHDFWHAINELMSGLDRPCVPNVLGRILPHMHCSLVINILLAPLQILLSTFKIFCKLCSLRLTIMASWRITILCTVLIKLKFMMERRKYQRLFPRPGIYLHTIFCHKRHERFTVQFWVVVHDQELQSIFLTPRQNFLLKNISHNLRVDFFMLKVTSSNHFTTFVGSPLVPHLLWVNLHHLIRNLFESKTPVTLEE